MRSLEEEKIARETQEDVEVIESLYCNLQMAGAKFNEEKNEEEKADDFRIKPKQIKKQKTLSLDDYKKFKFIDKINEKYIIEESLGQGAFGKVKKCTHIDTGSHFAIKIMKKEMVKKRKVYVELLENELSILGSKSHPKIIRIVDLMEDKTNYYIVSEIVEGGELFKRLCT